MIYLSLAAVLLLVLADIYVKQLVDRCRSGLEERFIDRLLLASIVECRGAERFRKVYEALDPGELKEFYHRLWASEAKHGNIFVKMALIYFDEDEIYKRLNELNEIEAEVTGQIMEIAIIVEKAAATPCPVASPIKTLKLLLD